MSLFVVRPHTAVRITQPFFEALIKSRNSRVRVYSSAVHFHLPRPSLTTTEIFLVFNPMEAKLLSGQAGFLVALVNVSALPQGCIQRPSGISTEMPWSWAFCLSPICEEGCISTLHMWQPCVKLRSDDRGVRDGVQRSGSNRTELQLYLLHHKK